MLTWNFINFLAPIDILFMFVARISFDISEQVQTVHRSEAIETERKKE